MASNDDSPWVVRTDFSSEAAWKTLKQAITAPQKEPGLDEEFLARVRFVEEQKYGGMPVDKLLRELPTAYPFDFLFVVDAKTMASPERPILVVGFASDESEAEGGGRKRGPVREFRALPKTMQSIENNLSIANMDYADFANSVQADGIFRGFPQ